MEIHLYQYIGILVGVVAFIFTLIRFREGKLSLGMLTLWGGVWIIIILVSLNPDATSSIALATGIGRGLDVILILGLIGCYYLLFKIYNMMENMEEEINHLVREMALERGKSGEKTEDEE
ncbi:MAG: hypothetical protein BME94_00695 [Methanobacteriales archaeon Met13]